MSPKTSLVMVINRGAGEQDFGQLGLHLGIGQTGSPLFGHNNDVRWRQKSLVAPKKLPQEALDAVATYRLARFAASHQPQPGAFALPRGQTDAEVRRVELFPPGLGPEVLPPAAEPYLPGETSSPGRSGGDYGLAGGLGGTIQRGSLPLKVRGASVLWPGGAAISGGRLWCSYGSGTRGCGPDAVDLVDKCVS